MNKTEAIEYAHATGWTKADARRAFEGIGFPLDELTILNKMVRFAGPELVQRQNLQRAQKGQVTRKKNQLEKIESNYKDMVEDYEAQLQLERSSFVGVIEIVYGIAKTFGYRDAWIDSLLRTYEDYSQDNQQEAA
ncbi:hypothetical protein C1752_00208 [Acaryochloris thomasi RCC1774]|uniref:Uncharacterized protein n=1 Tax=Acaryochloris thomasi RCC1774 TaxID=1764569 RepID=A0A2W1JPZ6_9CYAN|nr:hypothetical protein [Acaryochloris thomasi]PZD75418.1 hypothetical protein C1752_00208 [Acaryochloris thomasi RCC1774]